MFELISVCLPFPGDCFQGTFLWPWALQVALLALGSAGVQRLLKNNGIKYSQSPALRVAQNSTTTHLQTSFRYQQATDYTSDLGAGGRPHLPTKVPQ